MRIAFISDRDIHSRTSNAHFYMAQALALQGADVQHVRPSPGFINPRLQRLLTRVGINVGDQAYPYSAEYSRDCGKWITRHVRRSAFDLVFAATASRQIAFAQSDVPIVYSSDATVKLLIDYYPEYRRQHEQLMELFIDLEDRSLALASAVTYPSQWAADSAVRDHGADKAKISVIPWGANIDEEPDAAVATGRSNGTCRLLFLNTNWVRKGGECAIRTLQTLRERGVDASLTICGDAPPDLKCPEGVDVVGRLNKNDRAERARLYDILRTHHLLLFPTMAECYGHVICEANAFGMPVIARRTGGIGTAIHDGRNGFALAEDATEDDYASTVADVFSDWERYVELCLSSRREFDTRLNWTSWSRRLLDQISHLA